MTSDLLQAHPHPVETHQLVAAKSTSHAQQCASCISANRVLSTRHQGDSLNNSEGYLCICLGGHQSHDLFFLIFKACAHHFSLSLATCGQNAMQEEFLRIEMIPRGSNIQNMQCILSASSILGPKILNVARDYRLPE